jgi:methyl-accepting chemotaxis protein/plasmid stabilization system protein ParE
MTTVLEWISHAPEALWIFSSLIVAFALTQWFSYRRSVARVSNDAAALTAIVNDLPNDARSTQIRQILKASPIADTHVARRLDDLIDTLVRNPIDGTRYRSTVRPGEILAVHAVASRYINFRWFQGVPNVLIGLGLLFTFLGLTAALMFASAGAAASDIHVAQQALGGLLGAATFKFVTSLLGLSCSILFSLGEKSKYAKLTSTFYALQKAVEAKFPYISAQALTDVDRRQTSIERVARITANTNLEVLNQALEGEFALSLIREDIKRTREEAQEQTAILKTFSTDLAASIATAIDQCLRPQLTQTFGMLQESIEHIGQQLNSTNAEALRSIVQDFSSQFQEQARESVTQMLTAIEHLTSSMGAHSQRFATSFESVQAIVEQVRSEGSRALETTTELLDKFNDTLDSLDEISERLEQAAAPISAAAAGASSVIDGLRAAQTGATEMIGRLPAIADGFSGIDADLSAVFESIHGALSSELDDIRKFLRELDSSFSKAISGIHEVTTTLADGVDGLTGGLGDFSSATTNLQTIADNLAASTKAHIEAIAHRNGASDSTN